MQRTNWWMSQGWAQGGGMGEKGEGIKKNKLSVI